MDEQRPSPPNLDSRLALRPDEAADALGIGLTQLRELSLRTDDPVPRVKLGRSVMYPVAGLRAWLDRHCENN